jgi:large subunit ribosomal protein L10e
MSIRCRDSNRAVIIEALRRARYKFPGRQKIIVSKKWGFTPLDRADYEELKANKQVINDGAYVQVSAGGRAPSAERCGGEGEGVGERRHGSHGR